MSSHRHLIVAFALALACDATEPTSNGADERGPAPVETPSAPLHPPAPFWGELEPGPYGVGFELRVLEDPARRAPVGEPNSDAPRAILWALWYPTQSPSGEALRWIDYTHPRGHDNAERSFAERIHQHSLGVIAAIAFRRPSLPGRDTWLMLEADQVVRLERELETPVASYLDAPSTTQRHPALIYHPGAGGNFEENAVLFEYLASHGYVVLSSAYPSDARLNPSTEWTQSTDSFADIQFLWRALANRPDVDPTKIGLIGHSLGAQRLFAYALAHRGAAALVSLDTTFENLPLAERDEPTNDVHYLDPGRLRIPIANFYANPQPNLSFVESLRGSERSLVRIPEFEHDSFTTHGGVVRARLEEGERIFRDYQAMCVEIRAFLDETLLGVESSRPTASFERKTLHRAGIDTSIEAMVAELQAAGPDNVAALLDTSCDSQACVDLIPRALEELSFAPTLELPRAILAHLREPERRERLSSFEVDLIGGRLSMRDGDWSSAVEYFEHALAQLEKQPHPNEWLQLYFTRSATEQLAFVRRMIAAQTRSR